MEHLQELVWGTQKCLLKSKEGGREGGLLLKIPHLCSETKAGLGLELECMLSPDGATEEDGVLQND